MEYFLLKKNERFILFCSISEFLEDTYKVTEAGPIIGNESLRALHERATPGWAPRSRRVSLEPWTRQKILVLTTTPSLLAACAPRQTAAMPSRRYLSTGNSWSNRRRRRHRCHAVYMRTVRNGTERNARDLLQVLSWRGNKWPGLYVYARVPGERIRVRIFSPLPPPAPFPPRAGRRHLLGDATSRNGIEFPRGSTVVNPSVRMPATPDPDGARITRAKSPSSRRIGAAPGRASLSRRMPRDTRGQSPPLWPMWIRGNANSAGRPARARFDRIRLSKVSGIFARDKIRARNWLSENSPLIGTAISRGGERGGGVARKSRGRAATAFNSSTSVDTEGNTSDD